MGGPVWWRGHQFDQRTVDMLCEVERLTGHDLDVMQGSYSGGVGASAGTHDGCGAVDASTYARDPYTLVQEMRRVGFAAWYRTPAQGFDHHVHGIAVQAGGKADRGCLSGSAHDQVIDYFEGRNGLASGSKDDGPRQWVGVTWETYNKQPATAWLLEGVMQMSAHTIVMFRHGNTWFEADLIAGTYRGFSEGKDFADRKHVLSKAGVPWMVWNDGEPVQNVDAFGRRV